ncbi:recombination protein NinG [Litorivivens sp.]|uniref:recombination protein NinG n=1 Tax=Litorivivens sp. TaxID=2020868 RepID=UPI003564AD0C
MKPRKRKCKHCGDQYQPFNSMQKACSVPCAAALGKAAKERKDRQRTAEAKQRLKSRSDWLREAQAAFNKWVRLRDSALPCISCGRHHKGQYHAGHYRTVGANPELRFEPLNCHKQCAPCNNHKSGDIVNYRINLVQRIGQDLVEWLEGPHDPRKYTIDEIKEIKAEYSQKARELEKQLKNS